MSIVGDFLLLFSVFFKVKGTINENISFTDHAPGIWKNGSKVTVCWNDVIVKFFDSAVFLLSSLVTGPSFMSISFLVLDL